MDRRTALTARGRGHSRDARTHALAELCAANAPAMDNATDNTRATRSRGVSAPRATEPTTTPRGVARTSCGTRATLLRNAANL
eukprot:9240509-Lingulodinium_polyedra.AAC.1